MSENDNDDDDDGLIPVSQSHVQYSQMLISMTSLLPCSAYTKINQPCILVLTKKRADSIDF